MKNRFVVITVFLVMAGLLFQGTAQAGPMLAGFNSSSLPAEDDAPSYSANLGFTANFYGDSFTSLWVNNNGNVTFNAAQVTYTPYGLGADYTGQPIIAPFFADVDTRAGGAVTAYGTGSYGGHNAWGATWDGVGYYGNHIDKLNYFQVVLIDRSDTGAGNFDMMYNYNQILWETGDASGGTNGFGGYSASAGFSKGTAESGTYYEFPGSLVNGALLDSGGNSLAYNTNCGVTGRYYFEVRNGHPEPPAVPLPPSVLLLGSGLLGLGGLRFFRKRS
jgi:hypothetical protein